MIVSADYPCCILADEQDNVFPRAAKVGNLEPSDSQEAKDFVGIALELSEQFDMPILLRMTTRVCHSKSIVDLSKERTEKPLVPYAKQDKFNPIPAISKRLHTKVEQNLKRLEEYSESSPLNYVEWGEKKIGIISSGVAYEYAKEVYGENASYLKLGFTFPLPMRKIREFAARVDQLIVVEELEPIMENEIKAAGIPCIGKEKIPYEGELNPDILRQSLLGEEHETIRYDASVVAARPPVLCAGCPHRGFFYELQKMKNVITVSDIGCYGLAPKDIAICMGGGFSVAHGAQKIFNLESDGTRKRCVGIMGDSTFFHSGNDFHAGGGLQSLRHSDGCFRQSHHGHDRSPTKSGNRLDLSGRTYSYDQYRGGRASVGGQTYSDCQPVEAGGSSGCSEMGNGI